MTADDPQQLAVYAAEDSLLEQIGPRWRRWVEVEAFLESVLTSEAYADLFPDGPLDVGLGRRSRSATRSVAIASQQAILLRDGSWNAITLLHELAHLIVATEPDAVEPHGPEFVATELELVRAFCGFDQYVALQQAFREREVRVATG